MVFSKAQTDRERDKFIERPSGETAVRTWIANESGEPIPITNSDSAAENIQFDNLDTPAASAEYQFDFETNVKQFTLKSRDVTATLEVRLVSSGDYISLLGGAALTIDKIKIPTQSVFITSNVAGNVIEIIQTF